MYDWLELAKDILFFTIKHKNYKCNFCNKYLKIEFNDKYHCNNCFKIYNTFISYYIYNHNVSYISLMSNDTFITIDYVSNKTIFGDRPWSCEEEVIYDNDDNPIKQFYCQINEIHNIHPKSFKDDYMKLKNLSILL